MRINKMVILKHKKMIIIALVSIIALGGYVLNYQARSRLDTQNKEYETTKATLLELQKKEDTISEDIKRLHQENDDMLKKQEVCKTSLDELQKKYDELVEINVKLKNELLLLQPKTSTEVPKPDTTPSTTTLPPKGEEHPVKNLDKTKKDFDLPTSDKKEKTIP